MGNVPENVLEVKELNKSFGSKKVVSDLSFRVKAGDVFGFLGPNGAGKTTTIRMMLGLIHPDSGQVKINGHDIKTEFNQAIAKVGSVVETPKFYIGLTAYENLLLIANLHREVPCKRISEVLDIVGLKENAHEKVRGFSLGMKQRLGLARALINYPKLVFLDEPTNGLDPQGMHQIREMIAQLAVEQDITFFITSHLLYEIEQVCNKAAIIKNGKLIAQSLVKDMLRQDQETVEIYTQDIAGAVEILQTNNLVQSIESLPQKVQVQLKKGDSGRLNEFLIKHNIPVDYLVPKKQSLEQYFLELTEGGL